MGVGECIWSVVRERAKVYGGGGGGERAGVRAGERASGRASERASELACVRATE